MKPRIESNFTVSQQVKFAFGKPYLPCKSEFLLNNSRSAMLLALRALQLPAGTGVGMMVYNCHTVMNAIEQAGYTPVFVDVDDNLKIDIHDLKRKANGMSALVVTHLFGIVNDVRHIKELFPDMIILEDCAHAYGIENLFGDFATFSIGQGKLPSIGDGGLLVVRNDKYHGRVVSFYDNLPDYSLAQSTKLFVRLLLRSWMNSRIIYGWFTLPLKQKRPITSGKETIVLKKMCRGISAIYAAEKSKIPAIIEHRKQKAKEMRALLSTSDVLQVLVGINVFMLVVKSGHTKDIQKVLHRNGIDSATHFANALLWAKEFGYQKGSCPNIEKMMNCLLMVPTY